MAEAQARCGSAEFAQWIAYWEIEPWGDVRGDVQAATLAALIANANRDPSRRPQPFRPSDFVIDYWQAASQPPESLADKFRRITQPPDAND